MGWIFGVVFFLFVCYGLFIFAEHYELKKIRKAFDRFELSLLRRLEEERNTISHDGVTFGILPKETVQGAGYAVQRMLDVLEKEEPAIDRELFDFFKNLFRNMPSIRIKWED